VDTQPNLEHYQKLNLPFPVLLDRYNVLAPRYGFNNILPLTILISPPGRVIDIWEGYKEEISEGIQVKLKEVISESTKDQ